MSTKKLLVSLSALALLVTFVAAVLPGTAHAQTGYTRLQVLLPGESPAPGTVSGKTGQPYSQTVGIPFTARIRACDNQWNTQTAVTNLIQILATDETADLPPDLRLADGEALVELTLNADGQFTVQAHDLTDETIPDATSSSVRVVQLQGFEFERISQKNQYAGVPMPTSVWAVDPTGARVTSYNGPIQLRQLTSFGEGRVEPAQVTLVNGEWSGEVTMYRADETSINRGNVNLYAVLGADPTRNGTSDPFTVHPGPYRRVQIVVPGQTAEPGSASGVGGSPATQGAGEPFAVEVYATDQYWNQVPSADVVRIVSSDPQASTPISGALTNGYRSFSVALGSVGTHTLSVSNQTSGSIQGMTSAPIPVVPNSIGGFRVDPFTSPLQAGTPVTVTIRATDSSGNTVPEYQGSAIIAANTGPGSVSPETIEFTDGVWTGPMTFRGAGGAVSFTVSDYSSPPNIGTSDNFEVLPGPFVKLQVRLPGQTVAGGTASGLSGAASDQAAGSSFDVTVRAVDAYWNRVPGITDRVSLSSSDPYAETPAEVALANGEATVPVRLFRAGSQTVSAEDIDDSGIQSHTSDPLQIVPGNYARLLIIAPGENLAPGTEEGRDGAATDQSINYAFTVHIYATDQWFNPVGGVTDVVRLTSGDVLAELPADTPMVDGQVALNLRLSTGGFQQISVSNVTDPSIPSSTTQVRAISSGFHLEAEVAPTTVKAGDFFTLTVKVTNDAGSVIQEINSYVDIEIRHASSGDPGRGELTTTRFQLLQGQRTVSQAYTFAEPIQLVCRDDAGNAPAVTEVITVTPGDPARILLASDPPWVGGNKHANVTARVVDAFDNGVPQQPVDFAVIVGAGEIAAIDVETDDTGVANADFLSPRAPEKGRIRASTGSVSAELEIETAFVDPTAAGGLVTNYPNPFHPDEGPTTIAYKLDDNATVSLRIYTLGGGLVFEETFATGAAGGRAGLNEVVWDGRNGDGDYVATGGYVLLVKAEGTGETLHTMRRKIAVVR